LVEQRWNGRDYFGGWFNRPVNNARLALHSTYEGGRCAFANLFAEAGQDMVRFHDLAEAKSRLPKAQRRAWLQQSCSDIAPAAEL
ncbi:MAG: aminopeptidase, partial [Xanthomonadales bacterium]|nr:aminopeptidase [Xanthomonadales bacterium]